MRWHSFIHWSVNRDRSKWEVVSVVQTRKEDKGLAYEFQVLSHRLLVRMTDSETPTREMVRVWDRHAKMTKGLAFIPKTGCIQFLVGEWKRF